MRKIKGIIIVSCLCSFCMGCRPIKETRDAFQNTQFCYSSVKQYAGTINTEGYYVFPFNYQAHRGGKDDTSKTNTENTCVFFKDGSFIYNFSAEMLLTGIDPKSKTYSRRRHWGTWTVSNDTIKSQFIEPPAGMSWSRQQIWFKVIDKNTLELLAQDQDVTVNDVKKYKALASPSDRSRGSFVSFGPLPDPQKSWLMERKWFWCSKVEYRAWKSQKKAQRLQSNAHY